MNVHYQCVFYIMQISYTPCILNVWNCLSPQNKVLVLSCVFGVVLIWRGQLSQGNSHWHGWYTRPPRCRWSCKKGTILSLDLSPDRREEHPKQQDTLTVLLSCWASVSEAGPIFKQHCERAVFFWTSARFSARHILSVTNVVLTTLLLPWVHGCRSFF